MSADRNPRYRIQAVSEMTGIPAPTLRAWERRYGVPTPGRTGKGYRLYSPRDVELLTRMRDLCDSGISASDAARMINDGFAPVVPDPTSEEPGDPYSIVVERLVAAVVAFDADALEREVRVALTLGPAVGIFERIFAPAMRQIGDRWHAGTLSVAQEHMATEVLARASRTLLQLVQPTSAPRTAVLACWEEEQHVLPLYGIAFRLSQWGYRCVVLGQRTPPQALADAVQAMHPDVVGLSLTLAPPEPMLVQQIDAYVRAAGESTLLLGGRGVEDHRALFSRPGVIVHDGDLETLRRSLSGAG